MVIQILFFIFLFYVLFSFFGWILWWETLGYEFLINNGVRWYDTQKYALPTMVIGIPLGAYTIFHGLKFVIKRLIQIPSQLKELSDMKCAAEKRRLTDEIKKLKQKLEGCK